VREKASPHYDLETVRRAFRCGRAEVTSRVARHMRSHGMGRPTLFACVDALGPRDFHKSQVHITREGVWLDIYRPWVTGDRMYLKITEHEDGVSMLVLTYCRDGEAH
jgi:predicted transcriptional regulator